MVDGVGTQDWGHELTVKMEEHGIFTKVFHPLPWATSHWNKTQHSFLDLLSRINTRNHRKLCMIDNHIVYIGSANITYHLIPSDDDKSALWRDTSVKIIGADITPLQYAFDKAWSGFAFKKYIAGAFDKINPESVFRLNYSWRLRRSNYRDLISKLAHSKMRIWIENPYFVPRSKLLRKLIQARTRGVDVSIILPEKSDVWITSLASRTFYYTLIKKDVAIYNYKPRILHAKILMIDEWYQLGSSNMNHRSIKHDLEIDVILQTSEAKQELEQQFMEDLKNSKRITSAELKKQSYSVYILGWIILFIKNFI